MPSPDLGKMALRELIKTTLWPVLPKPWNSPDMEFHYGLWQGVSALYSESGRQLGEENTRPFALNHHIPAETIACRYDGSRAGRSINLSALRTAMKNFDAALSITQAVKDHHVSRKQSGEPIGLWDLYIISRASIALIAYSLRSHNDGQPVATVSDALTSQFQFISGVFMICRDMMENARGLIFSNQQLCAQELYHYADQNGLFVSFNGMACAGSTRKVLEFLEFCNRNEACPPTASSCLHEIVATPEDWFEYALATIELDCFVEQERLSRVGQNMSRGNEKSAADIYRDVGRYVRSLMLAPDYIAQHHSVFEDDALLRQNRILEILGQKRIRKLPARHVASRLY
ncbi:MAG: hypothetical protein AAGI28_15640 [Pseudomonadota bacterium]